MLYEVITRAVDEAADQADVILVIEMNTGQMLRITSYNVCYTKLLRSMGVDLGQDDVAFRCNIVCLKNDGADTEMEDYSAGHITTPEAAELLEALLV